MSLSSSLSNAFSGLTVTARAAQLVSSNLSNALNENYARREIEVASRHDGGAKYAQTNRFFDRALTSDLRNADSHLSLVNARSESVKALEYTVGTPENPSSLTAHLSRFDASLRFLESDPSSSIRLKDSLSTAISLTDKLSDVQADIQIQRQRADSQIAIAVASLNDKLQQIVSLNQEIVSTQINGRDNSTWLDQRQRLVDEVSALVPVREIRQANDAIALVSTNGMMLLEASAVQIDFTKSNIIAPHMTVESGDLGTLKLGSEMVAMSADTDPLSGGRLQGLFEVRDKTTINTQQQIDALALNLATRFQDLPNDGTITVNSAGLFTDNGFRGEPSNQVGIAGRLKVNSSVDPTEGGALWRLRSGLHATTASSAGDASLIGDMIFALSRPMPNGSMIEQAAELASSLAQRTSENDQARSFASAHREELRSLHLSNGVNTDAELQKLLQIETNYAANAKVMQTIDEMFAAILRIN